jgi:hypothetical protein
MLPLQSPLEAYRADLSRHLESTDFGAGYGVASGRALPIGFRARRGCAPNHCGELRVGDRGSCCDGGPDTPEEAAMIEQLAILRRSLPMIEAQRAAAEVVSLPASWRIRWGMGALCSRSVRWVMCDSRQPRLRIATWASRWPTRRGLRDRSETWTVRTSFTMAAAAGERYGQPSSAARALLGKGVMARVRGNYPKRAGILSMDSELADRAGLTDLAAVGHQGLLIAAATAGDHPTALVHGWAAYELAGVRGSSGGDPDQPRAGEPPRWPCARGSKRLPRVDGADGPASLQTPVSWRAAVASATLGDSAMVASLGRVAEESMSMTSLPFESASVLKSFFDAYRVSGAMKRAGR